MTPIDFKDANITLTAPRGMPDCKPLKVQDDGEQTLSAWSLTWRERFSALVFGRVWLCVKGGGTQPPVWLRAERDVHEAA